MDTDNTDSSETVVQQKNNPKIQVIKNHAQKLIPYLQHAQKQGCFSLEQASQIYAILVALTQA